VKEKFVGKECLEKQKINNGCIYNIFSIFVPIKDYSLKCINMKSKLFFIKSIALFYFVMLFVATGIAQNDAKVQIVTVPCEAKKATAENAKEHNLNETNDVSTDKPSITITSTDRHDPNENTKVQYANISMPDKKFTTNEVNIKDSDTPHYFASPRPEYIYGKRYLVEHILKNANYPKDAKKDRAEGIVLVQVIVEKDGSFTDTKVIQSVHPLLDEEAVRVVNTLSCFIPGKVNKEPVRSYYQIPVAFEYIDK
jgi:TonB family protein